MMAGGIQPNESQEDIGNGQFSCWSVFFPSIFTDLFETKKWLRKGLLDLDQNPQPDRKIIIGHVQVFSSNRTGNSED